MAQQEELRREGLIGLIRGKLCVSRKSAENFLEEKQITSIIDFYNLGYQDNSKLQQDFWEAY